MLLFKDKYNATYYLVKNKKGMYLLHEFRKSSTNEIFQSVEIKGENNVKIFIKNNSLKYKGKINNKKLNIRKADYIYKK